MRPPSIIFLPENRTVSFSDEPSVLDVALKNKIELSHSCGGMGSCTTCRVIVESDPADLPPRTELEEEIASDRGFHDRERLSCQLPPMDGLKVRIPLPKEQT